MKSRLPILLLLILSLPSFSQENIGIANSNYAGTNGLELNPSSMVDNKVWLDLNLVGASLFFHNDFVYLPKEEFYFPRDIRGNSSFPAPVYDPNGKKRKAYVDLGVMGPSFTLSLGKHAVGFRSAFRTTVDARRVPEPVGVFMYEGLRYDPQHGIPYIEDDFNANALSWAEFGISYGLIVRQFGHDLWTAGITLKRLYGVNSISLDVNELDYMVIDSSDLVINEFSGRYGVTAPQWKNGRGWGGDIGFTYKKMLDDVTHYIPNSRRDGCRHIDYKYKIGASLIDLGYIKFDQSSVYQEYEYATTYWSRYDTVTAEGTDEVDGELVDHFENNQAVSSRANSFTAMLPSAASVQFDYNIGKGFYANATMVQGFKFTNNLGPRRASTISITPRYEKKRIEVAMPLGLYEYKHPQLGLMLRLNNIIIGSDNILPFFVKMDTYGADIYFNLKITIFDNPFCNRKRGGKGKRGRRGNKGEDICPAYQ